MNAAGCLLLNIYNNNVFSYKNFQLTQTGYKLNKNHEWRWRFVSLSRMGVTHTFSAVCCISFFFSVLMLVHGRFFLNWITKFQLRFQHYTQLFFFVHFKYTSLWCWFFFYTFLFIINSPLNVIHGFISNISGWRLKYIQKRNTFVICFLILLIYTFFRKAQLY